MSVGVVNTKRQKDNTKSTKHYTEKSRLSFRNSTNTNQLLYVQVNKAYPSIGFSNNTMNRKIIKKTINYTAYLINCHIITIILIYPAIQRRITHNESRRFHSTVILYVTFIALPDHFKFVYFWQITYCVNVSDLQSVQFGFRIFSKRIWWNSIIFTRSLCIFCYDQVPFKGALASRY